LSERTEVVEEKNEQKERKINNKGQTKEK